MQKAGSPGPSLLVKAQEIDSAFEIKWIYLYNPNSTVRHHKTLKDRIGEIEDRKSVIYSRGVLL